MRLTRPGSAMGRKSLAGLAGLVSAAGAGCALRAADVAPLPTNAAPFALWSCERIDDESDAVLRLAAERAWHVDQRAGSNVVALGVGLMVFWPALLALRPQGPQAVELARLKGRHEALREAAARAGCAPPSPNLAPERAAALPVAPGESLVYEERPVPRRAATEQRWTLRAQRREGAEYAAAAAGASGAPGTAAGGDATLLRHDRLGNVLVAPRGALVWPQLLRGDLALGQVMAGEMLVAGDTLARARVRAQVVAQGPPVIAGRRFDAVVLELFGDVLQGDSGESATRLDGALVVDRGSGTLLRLDLRSAQAPFRGTRRLVGVEPRS